MVAYITDGLWYLSLNIGLAVYSSSGFSEFDDFMHNALGCLIGYGIYSLFRIEYEKFSKRPLAVL